MNTKVTDSGNILQYNKKMLPLWFETLKLVQCYQNATMYNILAFFEMRLDSYNT